MAEHKPEPIWVESCMSAEEYAEAHRKFPSTVRTSKPPLYDKDSYPGGKWRGDMGRTSTPEQIKINNKKLDQLYKRLEELQNEEKQLSN